MFLRTLHKNPRSDVLLFSFPRFFMSTCANSLNIFCYSAVFFFFFENLRSFSTRKKCENPNVFHCSIPLFHETAQVFLDYPIESNGISNSVLRFLTDTFVNICAHGFMHSYLDNSQHRKWNFRKQSVFTMRNCSERDTPEGTVTETPMFPLRVEPFYEKYFNVAPNLFIEINNSEIFVSHFISPLQLTRKYSSVFLPSKNRTFVEYYPRVSL